MGRRIASVLIAVALGVAGVSVATLLPGGESGQTAAAESCTAIGYQDGITAFFNWYRKQPGVPQRGPAYDPGELSTWPWVDKLERSFRILKDDHDSRCVPLPPPPPTTSPPPPPLLVAPQTYNPEGGSDAKFCTTGLPLNSAGRFQDAYATYDDQGLQLGGRTETPVPGLKGSRATDGRGPCDSYENDGRVFPPWPPESYNR